MKKTLSLVLAAILVIASIFSLASCVVTPPESEPVVKVIDIGLTEEEYAFAVAKGNSELLSQVNEFMAEITKNGTFDEILNKYFGDGTPTPVQSAATKKNDGSQLVVATNAAFAPFEYMEGENYYGVDLEIMALFAESIDKELYIANMEFDAVCLAVSTEGGSYGEGDEAVSVEGGIADIAAAGLTVNDERKEILDFSTSYYNASQMIVCAADDTTFDECETAEDVLAILNAMTAETKVGVQQATTGQFFCEGDADWGFEGFNFTTEPSSNGALAVQKVVQGTLDFVVIDEGPAKAIAENVNAAN